MTFLRITQQTIWKILSRSIVDERAYTMPLNMVYPKYERREWNNNSFVNLEVVVWYVKFRGA